MVEIVDSNLVKKLYLPAKDSHKGQNGKLTIIGGSHLFHGASLWALKTASRIVDMVFYCTEQENAHLANALKSKLYDFIYVPKEKIENYIEESDAILIGPGMVRDEPEVLGTQDSGLVNKNFTERLLLKYPSKKWLIDAGALQVVDKNIFFKLSDLVITPHKQEFTKVFNLGNNIDSDKLINLVQDKAREFNCAIVLKGKSDIICNKDRCMLNRTGNEGMTKGGTGDVLAGLIAALMCKNDSYLASAVGCFINGLAGDNLYKKVGVYYNASDLSDQIPQLLWKTLKK